MTVKGQIKLNLEFTGSEDQLNKLGAMMDRLIDAILHSVTMIGSGLIYASGMTRNFFGMPLLGGFGFFSLLFWEFD
jgi:hypothetical protein